MANAHAISAFAAFPIGRLVGGETSCHIVIRPRHLEEVFRRRPHPVVIRDRQGPQEVFHHRPQDRRQAGRRAHQDRVDTVAHAALTQAVSILAYFAIPMYG
ncbi:MAG: hypothetical protein K0R47_2862 [Brevibacillus sp.]|nr:hypothetical protein [Brevibacillus sp.]